MQSLRNGLAREDAARWADDADSLEAQRRAERAAEKLAAAATADEGVRVATLLLLAELRSEEAA